MSQDKTLKGSPNATFLQGSEGGPEHSTFQGGLQTDLFGREAAHANPFRWSGLKAAMKTKGTFGRSSPDLFVSANLQQSLESKLRQTLDVNGSPEYALTWKRWAMKSGPPICALRASAHQQSGKGFTGWPTAASRDWKDTPGMSETGTNPDGSERERLDQLPRVAHLVGNPAKCAKSTFATCMENTPQTAHAPGSIGGPSENSGPTSQPLTNTCEQLEMFGSTPLDGCAVTEKRDEFQGVDISGLILNPKFSAWLMGYPKEWTDAFLRVIAKRSR